MMNYWGDVRFAWTRLVRAPLVSAWVILPLGAAIGCAVAFGSIVQHVMLEPPPGVVAPDQLMSVVARPVSASDQALEGVSLPVFRSVRDALPRQRWAAFARFDGDIERGLNVTHTKIELVDEGYFSLLGLRPRLGRLLNAPDLSTHTAPAEIVLTSAVWSREFGRDSAVLGQTIVVNGSPFRIVGVVDGDFSSLTLEPTFGWIPLGRVTTFGLPVDAIESRFFTWLSVITRVASPQAEASLRVGVARLEATDRTDATAWQARGLAPRSLHVLRFERSGDVRGADARTAAQWLFLLSIVLVLIGTANVASLWVIRGVRDARAWLTMSALGASGARIARTLLIEGGILGVGASVVALIVALTLARVAETVPYLGGLVRLSRAGTTVAVVSGVCVLSIVALAPFASLPAANIYSRSLRARAPRWRSLLLPLLQVMQAALVSTLLVGAGTFATGLRSVLSRKHTIPTDSLLYVRLAEANTPSAKAYYTDLLERLHGAPWVRSATLTSAVPLVATTGYYIAPPASPPSGSVEPLEVAGSAVDSTYLHTLGLQVLQGRGFNATDVSGSDLVALVNETLAAEYVRTGVAPVGSCISASEERCNRRIVGIVKNSVYRSLGEGPTAFIYLPLAQAPPGAPLSVLIRTRGIASEQVSRLRALMAALPAPGPVMTRALSDISEVQARPWQTGVALLSGFGQLALVFAAVGIYSGNRLALESRAAEFAIRAALGAPPGKLARTAILTTIAVVGLGAVIGLVVALSALKQMPVSASAVSLSPNAFDIGAAFLALLGASTLGVLGPARRAAATDPAAALRLGEA